MAGKASCRQCGGSGVIYKKEKYVVDGKATTVETPTTCKRCNGSGEER